MQFAQIHFLRIKLFHYALTDIFEVIWFQCMYNSPGLQDSLGTVENSLNWH